jgi:GT2 family glycosyltransferase
MPNAPLASVIILGYWGREFVDDCLSSVLDQDLPPDQYEVLYIDNGSRDRAGELVREHYPRARVLTLEHNHGYAEGNNIGFRNTTGGIAVFLNEDTAVHRSWLRGLIEAVTSSPQIAAAHANIIQPWYPEYAGLAECGPAPAAYTSEVNRLGYIGYRRLPATDRLYDTLFLHGVCIALRRSTGEELSYVFDPDFFAYAEDLDLGLRVRALGYRSVAVPRATVYHKHRLQTSLSWRTMTKTVRIIRNRYLAFYKVMSGWEFALMVPLMTVGAPFNSLEFGLSRTRQVLYGLALAPATLVALVAALAQIPRYAAKRRDVRERGARRSSWCLRALWARSAVAR